MTSRAAFSLMAWTNLEADLAGLFANLVVPDMLLNGQGYNQAQVDYRVRQVSTRPAAAVCKQCNNEFEIKRTGYLPAFCSHGCAKLHRQGGHKQRSPAFEKCACGVILTPGKHGSPKKSCSEKCKIKARYQRVKEQRMVTKKTTAAITKQSESKALSGLRAVREAEAKFKEGLTILAQSISADSRPEYLAHVYKLVDAELVKPLAANVATMKEVLKTAAKDAGGKLETSFNGTRYTIEHRVTFRKQPSDANYLALVIGKGISPDDACIKEIVYKYSEQDARALVEAGQLTQAELDACKPVHQESLHVEKL